MATDGTTLLPNPAEQATLALIFELREAGCSLRGIAGDLNRRGIRSKGGGERIAITRCASVHEATSRDLLASRNSYADNQPVGRLLTRSSNSVEKTPFTRHPLIASLIGALILGAAAAAVSTFAFYDYLFGLGHTEHERGIARSLVAASTVGAATLVLVIGTVYWVVNLCYRPVRRKAIRFSSSSFLATTETGNRNTGRTAPP